MQLQPGMPAPAFTLPTTTGKEVSLEGLRGQAIILYFYPKDDTETCTKQACAFRDAMPRFKKLDALVLGISPDSVQSHEKFRKKYKLPFILLADEGHAITERYGVWKEKSMYGRTYMGVERTTFIIDPRSTITHVFPKVRVKGHVDRLAEALQSL
ncbi:MAG TPA: thioredoxin-dependent thiol peroxidase [Phycisphaerae bacterium]